MIWREYYLKGWGVLKVPRYITRLDSVNDQGHIKIAGWQVRYQRPWKYFSDSGVQPGKNNKGQQRGSPKASLKRATAYLESIYQGVNPSLRKTEHAHKTNHIGVGIRAVVRKHPHRKHLQYSIQVTAFPRLKKIQRDFYVGTEHTITKEKYQAAVEKAVALRKQLEAEYLEYLRTL